jgi:hypothetical protein
MAVKTFTDNTSLPASDINTFLANSGLVYIKQQTIGNGVASVSVTDVFSSTYNVYRVVVNDGVASTNCDLTIQLNGITTGLYTHNLLYMTNGSSTVNGFNQTNQTQWNYCGAGTSGNLHMSCEIFSPNVAKVKTIVAPYFFPTNGAGVGYYQSGGVCNSTTQATGFTLGTSSGTLTGGKITVYGYRLG